MDTMQRNSKSALTKLHKRGLASQSACSEAFDQCPAKHPNNQNSVKDFVVCSAECSVGHHW